VKGLSET